VQTGALLSSLLQELNARYPKEWQQDIAAAYVAASQRLLQQTDLAEKTLKAVPWKTASTHYELYYDHLGHQSQLLYLYAKHFPERLTSLPDNLFDGVAEQLNNRRYASLSAGSLLLALTQYGEAAKAQSKAPLKLSAILQNGSAQAFPFAEGLLQMVAVPKGSKSVQIQQDNPLALFYSLTESGFDRQGTATAEVKNGLEIQREFLDLTGHSIEKVTVGQEFLVRLRLRAIDQANIDQVAVVDMLPGGIEPVINRLVSPQVEGNESGDNSDSAHESTEEESTEEESTEEESTGEESTDEGAAEVATAVNNDGAAGNNNGAVSQALGEDIFIAGFSGEPRRSTWHADFADLRDDRVVIYGSLSRDMVTFTYRVRATNTGEYQVPAAYAEAMYNPAYFTRAKPGHLSIVKP
jgi:alpha-2-macroglobulin